jgi:hypothetical protein
LGLRVRIEDWIQGWDSSWDSGLGFTVGMQGQYLGSGFRVRIPGRSGFMVRVYGQGLWLKSGSEFRVYFGVCFFGKGIKELWELYYRSYVIKVI